ncbi:hypothetical protein L4C36_22505 [Photobacterium japonica]|uniref:HD domain-containing protein n=1 Tax=Photobacterium japonica TaxID=2910235 RepID=UPI003D0D83BF
MPLSQRFTALFSTKYQSLALRCFDVLTEHYSESHRHYHTLHHVTACLNQFDKLILDARHQGNTDYLSTNYRDLVLALWFHDVIYDPTQQNNEVKSAQFAQQWLRQLNESDSTIAAVSAYILTTAHTAQHAVDNTVIDTHAADTLLDIDLSILGAPTAHFQQYETAIRHEYHFVPGPQYQQGRIAVLQHFLEQPSIYRTEIYQRRYEQQARLNLNAAIQQLRAL